MSSDGFAPTIAIWGVGLIGGSLGMAWRRAGAAQQVIGIGREEQPEAVALGAVDRLVTDPAAALAQADLLVLAMPVGAMLHLAERWGPLVRPGTIVTDVGSTKEQVVAAWEQHLAPGAHFVGGHPLFGREKSGVEFASPDLPAGARWVLTPTGRTSPTALAAVERLARAAGALPLTMSPADHDRRVAGASHLPQVVATALAAGALQFDEAYGGVLDLAASGFRDTTRLAGSPGALWREILLTNQGAVGEAIAAFREALNALEAAVAAGDGEAIEALFARAQSGRERALRKA